MARATIQQAVWRRDHRGIGAFLAAMFYCGAMLSAIPLPHRVLLVINTNWQDSITIGNYYKMKRNIPDTNVLYVGINNSDALANYYSRTTFTRYTNELYHPIFNAISARGLADTIDYIVLSAGIPVRVLTPGATPGGDVSVATHLATASIYPIDEYSTWHTSTLSANSLVTGGYAFSCTNTYTSYGKFRLVAHLAGYSVADVERGIDNAIAGDGTQVAAKTGKWILQIGPYSVLPQNEGTNLASNWTKNTGIPAAWYAGSYNYKANNIKDVVVLLHGGTYSGYNYGNYKTYLPDPMASVGAYAEAHESFGCLPDHFFESRLQQQFPEPLYFRLGYATFSGAVIEPFLGFLRASAYTNYSEAFRSAFMKGFTALEAAFFTSWRDVRGPVTFIGDPLSRPFGKAAAVTIASPLNGTSVKGTLTVTANASLSGGTIQKIDLYIDDVLKTTAAGASISYTWNTAAIPDGEHTIYAAAYSTDRMLFPGYAVSRVIVTNGGVIPKPEPPSMVSKISATTNTMTFSWDDNAVNESVFNIYRSINNGAYALLLSVPQNTIQYTDSGLATNTVYAYKVAASNNAGQSALAGPLVHIANYVNAGPSNLITQTVKSNYITIKWDDRSSNESGFNIFTSTNGISFSRVTQTLPNATTWTHSSLKPLTMYYYKVSATNEYGESAFSGIASAKTSNVEPWPYITMTVLGSPPVKITANFTTNKSVQLSVVTSGYYGYFSTNSISGPYIRLDHPNAYSTSYSNLLTISRTTTIWYYTDVNGGLPRSPTNSVTITIDTVPPVMSGVANSMSTNASFTLPLDVDENYGYWSTNSAAGPFTQMTTSGQNLTISRTTSFWYYTRDTWGNNSATNSRTYTIVTDTTPPTVSASVGTITTNKAFSVALTTTENTGYFSTNGSAYVGFTTAGTNLTIDRTTTLNLYGRDALGNNSTTNTRTYTFDTTAPAVSASVGTITTNKAFTVALTTTENSGYFSTNGSAYAAFTTAGTNLTIDRTTTLNLYGRDALGNNSTTNTLTYTFDTTAPAVSASIGTVTTNLAFRTVLTTTENTGYFSTNGSAFTAFTTAGTNLFIDRTTTLNLYGRDALGNNSTTNTITYTVHKADLVISSIAWSPAYPKLGDYVTMSAVVSNAGLGASTNAFHAVVFWVDDIPLSVGGPTTSMASGAAITVTGTAKWSTNTTNVWTAVSGMHTVKALVDDINRIPEANEGNNYLTRTLDLAAPVVVASVGSVTTNAAFSVALTTTENNGYFSTNGSAYAAYTTAGTNITIDRTTTLSLYGRDAVSNSSTTNTYVYTVDMTAPSVSASMGTITTNKAFTVALTTTENTGYFSTNGSAYTVFTTAGTNLIISNTTTLLLYGRDALGNNSATNSRVFTIDTSAPLITMSPPALFTGSTTVAISLSDGTGYWSTNGGTNWTSFTVSTNIGISASTTFKVYARDALGNTSSTLSVLYPRHDGTLMSKVLWEVWTNIGGSDLASFTNSAAYKSGTAHASNYLSSCEAPSFWRDNYGTRMRGYIIAPVDGAYELYIASDDYGMLSLSDGTEPLNAVRIASVTGYTGVRDWLKYPSQRGTATLVAGKRYYFEALQKEGGGGDHLEIGWKKPGATNIEVIPGSALIAYGYDVTPPVVSIASPSSSVVAGSVPVTASVSDTGSGIAGVQLFVDGAAKGAENTAVPYTSIWDSTTAANGVHTLMLVARDAAGNTNASAPVSVTVVEKLSNDRFVNGSYTNGVAPGWSRWYGTNGIVAAFSKESNTQYEGDGAQKIVVTGYSNLDSIQFYRSGFDVAAGKRYRLTAWMKGTPGAKISLRLLKHSTPWTTYLNGTFAITDTWQQYALEADCTYSDTNTRFMVLFTTNCTVYVDGISCQEVPSVGGASVLLTASDGAQHSSSSIEGLTAAVSPVDQSVAIRFAFKGFCGNTETGFEYSTAGENSWTSIPSAQISGGRGIGEENTSYHCTWKIPSGFDTSKAYDIRVTVSAAQTVASAVAGNIEFTRMFSQQSSLAKAVAIGSPYRGEGAGIVFANLTADTSVKIFTVSGKFIADVVPPKDGMGKAVWDLMTTSGKRVSPGVYLCQLRSGTETKMLKVMVLR